ncbi:hypothetical protein B9G55_15750 [Saccharibacillus sp. O16]|nr:hypothetical protein B9G55_15750 [Saccharibacillus sp. O16]
MAIQTTNIIREILGAALEQQQFSLTGKWPRWSLLRTHHGQTDKIELVSESIQGAAGQRRMNINFAIEHPRSGQDTWMNRPFEEWFEYLDEEQLRKELKSQLPRIVEQVLPWMEQMRSEWDKRTTFS